MWGTRMDNSREAGAEGEYKSNFYDVCAAK